MILPASQIASIILLVLGLICWGSWANTFNASGKKWRFELYYFDFAIGAVFAALVFALTVGNLGWDGFSFKDDLLLAGKRQDLFAFIAGVVFNLGNMLLVAAISLIGISVAFSVGVSLSLAVAAIWTLVGGPPGSALFRIGGIVAVAISAIVASLAYQAWAKAKLIETIRTGQTKSTRKTVSMKGVLLAAAGALFLGSFYPLVQLARESEIGLGPYSLGFIFTIGVAASTFVFNLFFMNLPVAGKPVDMVEFFRAKAKSHVYGFLGGIVWYAGVLAILVVTRAEGPAHIEPALAYVLSNGGVVLAAAWGLLWWKELSGTDTKVNYQVVLSLVFLMVGIGLFSGALAFAPK
jgi:glucose uptake protein